MKRSGTLALRADRPSDECGLKDVPLAREGDRPQATMPVVSYRRAPDLRRSTIDNAGRSLFLQHIFRARRRVEPEGPGRVRRGHDRVAGAMHLQRA